MDDTNQILTPTSSLRHLPQQSEVRGVFNAWINGLQSGKDIHTHFQPHSNVGGNGSCLGNSKTNDTTVDIVIDDDISNDNMRPDITLPNTMVQIDFDDIKDEIVYWESTVICYVLGANPP